MKIFAWIVGIIGVLLIAFFVLLFSPLGNDFIKTQIEKSISTKISQKLEFSEFRLGLNSFNLVAKVNSDINLKAFGKYNIFTRSFDVNYSANAEKIAQIPVNFNLNGVLSGDLRDFSANASGKLGDSNINFNAEIVDLKPTDLHLDAKTLELRNIALLAFGKPYFSGKIDAVANINTKLGIQSGTAKISAPLIAPNLDLIMQDFNISLNNGLSASANSDIIINSGIAKAITSVNSPLINLGAKNSTYDITKNIFNTDFTAKISDLSKLEPIIKRKLKGAVEANANLQIAKGEIQSLDAKIMGLGGVINAKLKDDKINAEIKNIKLGEILKLLSLPQIANADINGIARISDITNSDKIGGNVNFQITKAALRHDALNALTGGNLQNDVNFIADTKIVLDDGKIELNSMLNSPVVKLAKLSGKYELSSKSGSGEFKANIPNLSAIFGSSTSGNVDLMANAKIKNAKIDAGEVNIDGLGGKIIANLNGEKLSAKAHNIGANELFALSGRKALFSGAINANVNLSSLNPQDLNGNADFSVKNGVLNSKNISEFTGKNFPQNIHFEFTAKPTFTNSIAYFSSNLKSDLANLSKFDGAYDINKNELNVDFIAQISDLSKLEFLLGKKLNANANGKIIYANTLNIDMNSDILDSKTKINLKGDKLNAASENFRAEKLLSMLGYGEFYEGHGNANLNYDLASKAGEFTANLSEGKIAKNGFTTALSTILGRDLSQEVYKNGVISGIINGDLVNFNGRLSSQKSDINTTDAKINLASKAISIPVSANIEKTDIKINITGTSDAPKYTVNSEYLTKKIGEKLINKIFKNDGESGSKNVAKELIKDLFN